MQRFWFSFLALIISLSVFSQNSHKKQSSNNTVYFELLGSAPIANIAYGHQISVSSNKHISIDLGIQYAPYYSNKWSLGMSPQLSFLTGTIHHAEIGIACYYDFYWKEIVPFPKFGYRYQRNAGGFMYKVEFTPLFMMLKPVTTIVPWAGVAIGWAF